MIAATLFSGIGAPECAMPHWRWAWCAEIEKFSSAVLKVRHPQSVNLGDVTADDFCERAAAIAKPDVLVFGSPCQSFSVAGRRLGLDDPRGNLALVALGIVARLAPTWFVFENVPGLLSSADGSDFGLFLRAVDDIGYSGAWASLDAQHFNVAQRRERLFFVGHSGDWRYPAAVLLEPESVCGDHPPRREARQRPAGCLEACAKGTFGTDFMCDGGLVAADLRNGTLDDVGHNVGEDGTGRDAPLVPMAFSSKDCGADAISDLAPTLRAGTHDRSHANAGVPPAIAFQSNAGSRGGDVHSELCPTLRVQKDGGGGMPAVAVALRGRAAELSEVPSALLASQGGGDKAHVLTGFQTRGSNIDIGDIAGTFGSNADRASGSAPMLQVSSAVRRLTPRECERLQAFSDDYTLIAYRNKPAPDGNRYKALGNSMCVNVVRWILTRIELMEDK